MFQTRLVTAAPGYSERISAISEELSRNESRENMGFLNNLVLRDIATLQNLLETVDEKMLERTAHALKSADTIYIAGQLRSEPIALFLRYVLSMLDRRVILLDPAGGLATQMTNVMRPHDVLIAISFRYYAKEVVAICEAARERGAFTVGITDSILSPLAPNSTILFTVPEDDDSFSRSLAAPMCLVQSLAIATAAQLQPVSESGRPKIPTVSEKQNGPQKQSDTKRRA